MFVWFLGLGLFFMKRGGYRQTVIASVRRSGMGKAVPDTTQAVTLVCEAVVVAAGLVDWLE
jgi:hypothetical protein